MLGIFSIALVIMVGGSLAYGTSSNALDADGDDEDERIARCVMFILVTATASPSGVALTMLGLHPLLIYIELEDIAEIMAWLLLFSLFAGGNRLGAWMYALLGTRNRVSALASPQAIVVAGVYRLVLVPRFPGAVAAEEPGDRVLGAGDDDRRPSRSSSRPRCCATTAMRRRAESCAGSAPARSRR